MQLQLLAQLSASLPDLPRSHWARTLATALWATAQLRPLPLLPLRAPAAATSTPAVFVIGLRNTSRERQRQQQQGQGATGPGGPGAPELWGQGRRGLHRPDSLALEVQSRVLLLVELLVEAVKHADAQNHAPGSSRSSSGSSSGCSSGGQPLGFADSHIRASSSSSSGSSSRLPRGSPCTVLRTEHLWEAEESAAEGRVLLSLADLAILLPSLCKLHVRPPAPWLLRLLRYTTQHEPLLALPGPPLTRRAQIPVTSSRGAPHLAHGSSGSSSSSGPVPHAPHHGQGDPLRTRELAGQAAKQLQPLAIRNPGDLACIRNPGDLACVLRALSSLGLRLLRPNVAPYVMAAVHAAPQLRGAELVALLTALVCSYPRCSRGPPPPVLRASVQALLPELQKWLPRLTARELVRVAVALGQLQCSSSSSSSGGGGGSGTGGGSGSGSGSSSSSGSTSSSSSGSSSSSSSSSGGLLGTGSGTSVSPVPLLLPLPPSFLLTLQSVSLARSGSLPPRYLCSLLWAYRQLQAQAADPFPSHLAMRVATLLRMSSK